MPANLAVVAPLETVIFNIELKLERLGWLEIERIGDRRKCFLKEGRLTAWAVAAAEAGGTPQQEVLGFLGSCPSDKKWWAVRQLLPESALRALERKLDGLLMQEDESA